MTNPNPSPHVSQHAVDRAGVAVPVVYVPLTATIITVYEKARIYQK